MPQHTPGPWIATDDCLVHTADLSLTVATVGGDGTNADANARVIALTPEFVTVLNSLVEIQDEWTGDDDPTTILECFSNIAEEARALLAKIGEA